MTDIEIYRISHANGLGEIQPKPEGKIWVRVDDSVLYFLPSTARIIYDSLKVLRRKHVI